MKQPFKKGDFVRITKEIARPFIGTIAVVTKFVGKMKPPNAVCTPGVKLRPIVSKETNWDDSWIFNIERYGIELVCHAKEARPTRRRRK